jgi:acyl carrier protein
MASIEQIQAVLARELYDIEGQKAVDALNGITHQNSYDVGLDSLDLVELGMAVEDEFSIYLDDSYLDDHLTGDTLLEAIPNVIFNAQRGN